MLNTAYGTPDETFVHILSQNSNLASRLYGEGRAVALLEVDLLTRSGLNMAQKVLSDEDEGNLVSQYDEKNTVKTTRNMRIKIKDDLKD